MSSISGGTMSDTGWWKKVVFQVNVGSYISAMAGQIVSKLISERELINDIPWTSSVSVKMSVIVEIIALMSEAFYFSIF